MSVMSKCARLYMLVSAALKAGLTACLKDQKNTSVLSDPKSANGLAASQQANDQDWYAFRRGAPKLRQGGHAACAMPSAPTVRP